MQQTASAIGLTPLAANTLKAFGQQGSVTETAPVNDADVRIMEGTAGALLVEQLRAAGIKYIFHTNTSGVAPVMDALVDARDMQLIMVTHEDHTVSSAHGYAMATGELPFVIVSSDGIDHVGSNLHSAFDDTTPLIVSFQGGSLDHLESYSVWSHECTDAQSIPAMLRRGIKYAVAPPGGPVTMIFPSNLQAQKIKAPIHKIESPVKNRPVVRAPRTDIEKLAKWLVEAKNPVFVVGREVSQTGASAAIQALAEKLSVPVYQSHRRDCIYSDFPTDHPLFVGVHISPQRFPQNCDLFVSFGALLNWSEPPEGARVVHVSFDASRLENMIPPQFPVLSDVAVAVKDLTDAVDGMLTADRTATIRSARLGEVTAFARMMRQSREIALKGRFDEKPISWERVGYELERILDKNAIVVPELGSQDQKLQGQMTFGPGNKTRLGRTTCGQLGWGMGAAFGAQLAFPDRQVVAVQGDGGMLFGQTEALWSIARYEAPVLTIVMNNYSYNETRIRNVSAGPAMFREQKDMTSYLGSPNVDFAKIASGYGIGGEKVSDPNQLGPALQRAVRQMAAGKPYMLDIEVTRDGFLSESTWHPRFSIAELGRRRA